MPGGGVVHPRPKYIMHAHVLVFPSLLDSFSPVSTTSVQLVAGGGGDT